MQEKYESEKFQIEIFFTRGSGFRTHKLNFFFLFKCVFTDSGLYFLMIVSYI